MIAAEFAYIFSAFGCKVTILSRSGFLKNLDRHLRAIAFKELADVDIREGVVVTSITGTTRVEGVRYQMAGTDAEIPCDNVLLATGLIPNTGMVSGMDKGPGGRYHR